METFTNHDTLRTMYCCVTMLTLASPLASGLLDAKCGLWFRVDLYHFRVKTACFSVFLYSFCIAFVAYCRLCIFKQTLACVALHSMPNET